jgi:hypothetical protein
MNQFLQEHRVTKKDDATHVGMGKQKGKYRILENELEYFYNDILFNELKSTSVSLLEKQKDVSKIVIDLDFKSNTDFDRCTIYTDDIILKLIRIYNKHISSAIGIDINNNNDYLSFILSRGHTYKIDGYYKNGLHIQYPNIACHHSYKSIIRLNVLKEIKEIGLFDELDLKNTYDDVIDKAIIKSNAWYLYGCSKPDMKPYVIVQYYNVDKDSLIDLENPFKPLIYDLSQRYINDKVHIHNEVYSILPKIEKKLLKPSSPKSGVIKQLLTIHSPRRVDDYEEWINTGMGLKTSGLKDGLDLFHEFSKRSNKYDASVVNEKWDSFEENGTITLGSIYYNAKKDNENEYYEIMKSQFHIGTFSQQMKRDFNHADMANIFINMYKGDFVISMGCLYSWDGFIWIREDIKNPSKIYNKLSGEFYTKCEELFETAINEMEDELSGLEEDDPSIIDLKLKIGKYTAYIGKISTLLKKGNEVSHVVKAVLRNIVDDTIAFDEQPNVFCFLDQYIDITKIGTDSYLMKPNKELYISETSGHKYNHRPLTDKEFDILKNDTKYDDGDLDDEFKFIYENVIKPIFPHTEVRTLALKILSTGLSGVTLEHFILFTGSGRNGKGVIDDNLMYMFGGYGYEANINMLTKPIPENGSPALANLDNKRFVVTNEPSESQKLDVSSIKKLTGGSKLNARALFSNKTTTRLKSTLFLECNEKPKLDGVANNAIENRLIEIPFISEFYDDESKVNHEKHRYAMNKYLKSTECFDKYKHMWFSILSMYFNEYHNKDKEQLIIPKATKALTMKFINSSNSMNDYFEDLVFTDNVDDVISIKDDLFLNYSTSEYYEKMTKKQFLEKVQKSNIVKDYFKDRHKRNGKDHRNVLVGVKLPEMEEHNWGDD